MSVTIKLFSLTYIDFVTITIIWTKRHTEIELVRFNINTKKLKKLRK